MICAARNTSSNSTNSSAVWAWATLPGPNATAGIPCCRKNSRVTKPRRANCLLAKRADKRILRVGVQWSADADQLHFHGQVFAQLPQDFLVVFPGHRAAVDFDLAVVRHDVDLRASTDNADIGRGRAEDRVMDSLERIGVLPEQIIHNARHFLDRAFAPLGRGTVDALAARDDLERDRPLCV